MDPRLLRHYAEELGHLREVGAEFARDHPKIAARLGLEGVEVADPYVERLLEGFAFMAARVQLQIEAEQPRLVAQLLESLYPGFLAPLPSTMVARYQVDPADPNLARGHLVPRDSAIQSELTRGQDTRCEFRSAHDVTLWPIELVSAQYFSYAPDLPLTRLAGAQAIKGGLRIRLRCGGGQDFSRLGMDRLALHIAAPDAVAWRLHELVLGACLGSWIAPPRGEPPAAGWRGTASVQPLGFDDAQALLPTSLRAFSGHRLLQELATLPQRFLFFEIGDLAARLAAAGGQEVELVLLFSRGDPALESLVDGGSLALFCTPAINLFPKRLDRVALGPGAWEHHLVPDRTRPMDFEIHSVMSVVGHGSGRHAQREFRPLYATRYDERGTDLDTAYYTLRREPRRLSSRQRLQGPRSAYVGEEVFVSLVDGRHGPYREGVRQLAVQALVTNRDLPVLLPQAGAGQGGWRLDAPGPVSRVELLRGPTRPLSRRPVGSLGWQLVSHLALNHLELAGGHPGENAAALKRLLMLYGPPEDAAWAHQVDGVRQLAVRQAVRRLPFDGPLTFGTGNEVSLELDELAFQGSSAFLFACVLERYFARHAAINSFSQLTLRTAQRGELMRWPPRIGLQETL
jgi:type VI secretion system protein ImpG